MTKGLQRLYDKWNISVIICHADVPCRSLFVMLSFCFRSLCCLSFIDLLILITPLVSSSSSWNNRYNNHAVVIMIWVTVRKYPYLEWQSLHNFCLSSISNTTSIVLIYMINTACVLCEACTAYFSRASGFTPGFWYVSVLLIVVVFCVAFLCFGCLLRHDMHAVSLRNVHSCLKCTVTMWLPCWTPLMTGHSVCRDY
jgi:hypothetical protein